MVTIRQVASKAGVSTGTVSRVLNNKPGVGDETRRHVLDVANEMGYTISKRAMANRVPVTHLGLLSRPLQGGLLANPFYQAVFVGVEQACQEHHINLSISTLDIQNDGLRSLPPLLNNEGLSGLILVGALPYEILASFTERIALPVVLVDNSYPDCHWDTVMVDNRSGMQLVVDYLIASGHRRIGLISGPDHPSIQERCQGYQAALNRRELQPLIIVPDDLNPEDGEWGAAEIMRRAPHTSAIVCSNDMQAIGALKRLRRLGYQVPGEISVTGFDDIDLARYTSPALTTVRVDRIALGQIATQTLIERIANPERPALRTILTVELVERCSVRHLESV